MAIEKLLSRSSKKSLPMSLPDEAGRREPIVKRARFLTGIALIGVSFSVYLVYFVIVLVLPFSAEKKVLAILAASLLSWAGFSAGVFLVGHDRYRKLRKRKTSER